MNVIPAANTNGAFTPVGTTISILCTEGPVVDPAVVGAGVRFLFDTLGTRIQNNNEVPGPGPPPQMNFETYTMTCTSSGEWQFNIFEFSLAVTQPPLSGIITGAGAVECLECPAVINPYCTPPG
uniref:Uncharacterized protein n=1 Tax=Plectus sambesii TaxID=2011161 RepID=A0A914XE66_9BILA